MAGFKFRGSSFFIKLYFTDVTIVASSMRQFGRSLYYKVGGGQEARKSPFFHVIKFLCVPEIKYRDRFNFIGSFFGSHRHSSIGSWKASYFF
jgi:hypothetical protein